MANKHEKQAHRVIDLSGDDIEWFDQLIERQTVEVQRSVIDLLHFRALAIIELFRDQPDKLDEALAGEKAVTRKAVLQLLQAQGLAAEKRENAARRHGGFVSPEKEVTDGSDIKDTLGVEPVRQDGPAEYISKVEPDLNEVRDEYRENNVPAKGPLCPDKPLIVPSLPTRSVRIIITRDDATVTIDL